MKQGFEKNLISINLENLSFKIKILEMYDITIKISSAIYLDSKTNKTSTKKS